MKKFALKASAAAIGVLVGSAAVAGVDTTGGSAVNVGGVLASEFNYDGGVAPLAGPVSTAGGQTSYKTKLGFGVSAGQTRFIRVNVLGATLNGAAAGSDITGFLQTGVAPAGTSVTVVAGGGVGSSTVTYQITAGTAAIGGQNGEPQDQQITITLPALRVTNSNAAPVTASYALYNDAPSSVSQTGALNTNTAPVSLLTFATALGFTLTPNTNTSSVATQYRTFLATTGTAPLATAQLAPIGRFAFGTTTTKAANNTTVTIDDLIDDATLTIAGGTFTATSGAIYIGNTAGTLLTPITLNGGKTGGSVSIGTAVRSNGADNNTLWYSVSAANTVAIPVQSNITAALAVTPDAGVNAVGTMAAKIGDIAQDGTQLQSPFYQSNTNNVSRFILTNTSGVPATWTAQVYPDAAQTFTPAATTGSIPANGFVIITAASLGTYSGAQGRGFVVFTVDRPRTDIQGVYNYQSISSGATSQTVLVAPGTN